MSLLFNMLSRLVVTFLPRSKCPLISWLESWSEVMLGPKKRKSVAFFLICLPWSDGTVCHHLRFLNVKLYASFFTLSFTFIKRLFNSSLLSAIKVVPSAYPRSFICLPTILIPAWASSSPAFCMMYSTYKLNTYVDNIQPWCTPFPILNQSVLPRLVPAAASSLNTGFSGGRKGGLVFPSL